MMSGTKRAGTATSPRATKKPTRLKQEDPNVAPEEARSSGSPNDAAFQHIPDLISMNGSRKDDAAEVQEALHQLAALCHTEDSRTPEEATENGKQIFRHRGHELVVKTMKRFPNELGIQMEGSRIFQNACCNEDDDAHSLSVEAGGIESVETIVKAMEKSPKSRLLQEWTTGAIMNLVWECRENTDRFMKVEGIQPVIAAMKKFKVNRKIQLHGCYIVHSCADLLLNNQYELIQHGAAIVVAEALTNHLGDEEVKVRACVALDALSKSD